MGLKVQIKTSISGTFGNLAFAFFDSFYSMLTTFFNRIRICCVFFFFFLNNAKLLYDLSFHLTILVDINA